MASVLQDGPTHSETVKTKAETHLNILSPLLGVFQPVRDVISPSTENPAGALLSAVA